MTPDAALVSALVGVAVALLPATYGPARHVVTAVHEAGHACVALLAGRTVQGVRLRRDSSGEAVSIGRARGFGVVITLLAGYPAPSVAGVAGVVAAHGGHALAWLAVMAGITVVMTLMLRNVFGLFVVLSLVAVLLAAMRYVEPGTAAPLVNALGWFLVVAAVRSTRELATARGSSDSSALAGVTVVPAFVWTTLFGLLSLAALGFCVWWSHGPAR